MRTVTLKTSCRNNLAITTLAQPDAQPGDYRLASIQIRRVHNVPDDVDSFQLIRLFDKTVDATGFGDVPQRLEFDFSELGETIKV